VAVSDGDFAVRAAELAARLLGQAGKVGDDRTSTAVSYGPLQRTAALMGTFTLDALKETAERLGLSDSASPEDSPDEIDTLLDQSLTTSRADGPVRWLLRPDVRGAVLKAMLDDGSLRKGLEQLGDGVGDPLSRMLAGYFAGRAKPVSSCTADELHYALQLAQWLGGEGTRGVLPAVEDVQRALQLAELLQPFRLLVANFQGRTRELQTLRAYVDTLPSEGAFEAIGRTVQGAIDAVGRTVQAIVPYFDLGEKPPLMIQGLGGVGKTSLVGKFLIDHLEHTSSSELAFVYVDFDRPGFSIIEPLTILVDGARQLAAQYPAHREALLSLSQGWHERLARAERSNSRPAGLDKELVQVSSSTATERERYLREFSAQWERMRLGNVPLLAVLDSFEEVHRGNDVRMRQFFEFLQQWSAVIPRLRCVLAGRSRPTQFKTQTLELAGFDEPSAIGYLASRGIDDPEASRLIYREVGGNPLNLRLAAEEAVRTAETQGTKADRASVRETFKDLRTREKLVFRLKDEVIQQVLFERNLSHIRDDEVRKLAFPGLLLRRIDAAVVREVLAEPCGLGVVDEVRAAALVGKLSAETFLIDEKSDQELRYRVDLRKMLLPWIESSRRVDARRIHDLAVRHYDTIPEDYARAEAAYHRLKRGDDPLGLKPPSWKRLQPFLEGALDELPPSASVFLGDQFGIDVPKEIAEQAGLEVRLAHLAGRSRRLLVSASEDDLRSAVGVIQQTPGRDSHGALRRVEAALQERLGDYETSEAVAESALLLPATGEDALEHEPELRLLLARISERRADYATAAERYARALDVMRRSSWKGPAFEAWVGQFRTLHRLQLDYDGFASRRRELFGLLPELIERGERDAVARGLNATRNQLPAFHRDAVQQWIESGQPVGENEVSKVFEGSWFLPAARFERALQALTLRAETTPGLEKLVSERSELVLREIAAPGALAPVAFDVALFAEAMGRLEPLSSRPRGRPRGEWKDTEFAQSLEDAAGRLELAEVTGLCNDLVLHLRSRQDPFPERSATKVLSTLRRKRQFELTARVGDALLQAGQDAPRVRRLYAQALLDLEQLSAALGILREIERQQGLPAAELAEVRGLVGRAYKQMYINAGDPTVPLNREHLLSAIDVYHAAYRADPGNLWHGINAASLLLLAERDGVDRGDRPAPSQIALAVLQAVRDRLGQDSAQAWDLATAAEASMVLGRYRDATDYLARYVGNEATDAFELASTLRQFEQVLRLDGAIAEERLLLNMLRARLLERQGGALEADAETVQRSRADSNAPTRLEATLGSELRSSFSWWSLGLRRARGVARITRGGQHVGTGFLVPGEALSPNWKGDQILCTNNHLLSRTPGLPGTIGPEEASIIFESLRDSSPDPPIYKVARVLFESAAAILDVTFCRLDRRVDGVDPFEVAKAPPEKSRNQRIYVIGYRRGEDLSVSFQDNALLDLNEKRIHYRSSTEPGTGGSPLFNDQWELIGIHHARGTQIPRLDKPEEVYEASEGIPWTAIRNGIASSIAELKPRSRSR
jgi:tetratricopeptide (TPR) repeat protein